LGRFVTPQETSIIEKDGVSIYDSNIVDTINKSSLSNSMIDGVLQCPAKYISEKYLIKDLLPSDPLSPNVLGSAFHKIMEVFFQYPKDNRTSSSIREAYDTALEDPEFASVKESPEARNWVKNCVNGFWRLKTHPETIDIAYMKNDWGKTVPGIELFVSGKIGNASRNTLGFIDRLSTNSDGSLIIDDWKTGAKVKDYDPKAKFPDFSYLRQQTAYTMLLEEQGYTVAGANLVYPIAQWFENVGSKKGPEVIRHGKITALPVHDKAVRKKVIEDVETSSLIIDSCLARNKYDCNPSPLCSWCPLVNICPAAMKISKPNAVASRKDQPHFDTFKGRLENTTGMDCN
jgi:putative RecB family exonuclease